MLKFFLEQISYNVDTVDTKKSYYFFKITADIKYFEQNHRARHYLHFEVADNYFDDG